MSRKYKFYNKEGLYFVSFATVYWLDVFTRDHYSWALVESLDFCRKNKGMEIYAWCIMSSHVHLIFRAKDNNPGDLLRDFKTFTSKKIQELIEENPQESRKEWLIWLMQRAGTKNSNVKDKQFWQQHNKPIELWSPEVINQKVDYIHMNPVEAGFVTEPHYWKLIMFNNCGHELQARASWGGQDFPIFIGINLSSFNPTYFSYKTKARAFKLRL